MLISYHLLLRTKTVPLALAFLLPSFWVRLAYQSTVPAPLSFVVPLPLNRYHLLTNFCYPVLGTTCSPECGTSTRKTEYVHPLGACTPLYIRRYQHQFDRVRLAKALFLYHFRLWYRYPSKWYHLLKRFCYRELGSLAKPEPGTRTGKTEYVYHLLGTVCYPDMVLAPSWCRCWRRCLKSFPELDNFGLISLDYKLLDGLGLVWMVLVWSGWSWSGLDGLGLV